MPHSSNVLFMLQHPLVPLEITSAGIEVRRAQATLFGQEASQRESILLFCSAVIGVPPFFLCVMCVMWYLLVSSSMSVSVLI